MLRQVDRWKIEKQSFEVGVAGLAKTYQEALQRGWYDAAKLLDKYEPQSDESV